MGRDERTDVATEPRQGGPRVPAPAPEPGTTLRFVGNRPITLAPSAEEDSLVSDDNEGAASASLPVDADLPIDPDLPVEQPRLGHRARGVVRDRWDILAVIAGGGALGSAARYGVAEALPHDVGAFAMSTVAVNLCGGFLLGFLMVFVMDVWPPTRYVRPFLGVGILGGFTTFSTYMVDTRAMLASGPPTGGVLYLFGTLALGLAAVWLGIGAARGLVQARHRRRAASHLNSGKTSHGSTDRSQP